MGVYHTAQPGGGYSINLEVIFHTPKVRPDSVLPIKSLAFDIGSPRARNPNLAYTTGSTRHFGGKFGLKPEAVFGDPDGLNYISANRFVTGRNVRDVS